MVAVPKIRVVFELEDGNHRIPVLLVKSSVEASVRDWSKQMHMKGMSLNFVIVLKCVDKLLI
jgi:hypothetical protein